jgi:hypothetical protein
MDDLDLNSEEVPPEVSDHAGDDEEARKKAEQGWKRLKNTLKTAKGVIQTLSEGQATPPHPASPSGPVDDQNKAAQILQGLTLQAMTNTGLSDPDNPLVVMERQRLYNQFAEVATRRAAAEKEARKVFNEVVVGDQRLTEEDHAEIKKELSQLDPLVQADEETVRRMTWQYLGRNVDRFAERRAAAGENDGSQVSEGGTAQTSQSAPASGSADSAAAAAAASQVKSKGSGVRPGVGAPATRPDDKVKPASQDERRRMKAVGLDPSNLEAVKLFRRSESKKDRYEGAF